MSLIDIKKLSAELDKMIGQQKVEMDGMDKQIAANKNAKWTAFARDLEELQGVVDEIKCDRIYVPFATINGRDYDLGFTPFSSVALFWNNRQCIATGIVTRRTYEQWKNKECSAYYDMLMNVWPEVKDGFTKRFEEACVRGLKAKAEIANARYEKKLKEVADS